MLFMSVESSAVVVDIITEVIEDSEKVVIDDVNVVVFSTVVDSVVGCAVVVVVVVVITSAVVVSAVVVSWSVVTPSGG